MKGSLFLYFTSNLEKSFNYEKKIFKFFGKCGDYWSGKMRKVLF